MWDSLQLLVTPAPENLTVLASEGTCIYIYPNRHKRMHRYMIKNKINLKNRRRKHRLDHPLKAGQLFKVVFCCLSGTRTSGSKLLNTKMLPFSCSKVSRVLMMMMLSDTSHVNKHCCAAEVLRGSWWCRTLAFEQPAL